MTDAQSLGGTWDPLFPPGNPLKHNIVGWTFQKSVQGIKGVFNARDGPNVAPEQTTCPGNWLYLTWAAGLWIYQSLDAIDGKQARKTKTSGPLGEMFDHGCDALNTTVRSGVALASRFAQQAAQLEVLLTAAALNLGQSWWAGASLPGSVRFSRCLHIAQSPRKLLPSPTST